MFYTNLMLQTGGVFSNATLPVSIAVEQDMRTTWKGLVMKACSELFEAPRFGNFNALHKYDNVYIFERNRIN